MSRDLSKGELQIRLRDVLQECDDLRNMLQRYREENERLREAMWKIERNEDAEYSRDLARQALQEPKP